MEYKINYWYDRITRSWVIQVYDIRSSIPIEVDCSYVGNKADRDIEIAYLQWKYNTDNVSKI